MDDYMKDMSNNPPKNISNNYYKAPEDTKEFLINEYGEYSTCFGVKCECGNQDVHINGYIIEKRIKENSLLFTDDLSIYCDKCKKDILIFDSDKDGYNGEIDQIDGHIKKWKKKNGDMMIYDFQEDNKKVIHIKGEFICPKCNGNTFKLTVLFQYDGDEDLKEALEDEELIKRKQDFYGWFSAATICNNCGVIHEIISVECA